MRKSIWAISLMLAVCTESVSQNPVEWALELPHNASTAFVMEQTSFSVNQAEQIAVFGIVGPTTNFGIQQYGTLGFELFDPSGSSISSVQFTGNGAVSQMVSFNNHFYVVGQFLDSLKFPGFPVLSTLGQVEPRSGFVGKFDALGNPLWVLDLNDVSTGLSSTSISVSGNGHIAVGTYSAGGAASGNSSILHLDDNGLLVNTWPMNGLAAVAAVSINANGSIAFSGSCAADSLELNGQSVTAINDYNQLYGLFDSTGTLHWVKSVLDVTCVFPGIHLDDSDNTYFCADSHIQADLDSIPIHPADWVFAFYVGKVNSSGSAEWVYQTEPDSLVLGDSERSFDRNIGNAAGGITINGRTRGSVDWGNGLTSGAGLPDSDLFSLTIDENGNAVQVLSSGIGAWSKKAHSSIQNGPATHTYMLISNMDTLQLPSYSLPGSGINLFLIKWSNSANSVNQIHEQTVKHYPDPATATICLTGFANVSSVVFHDLSGRIIRTLPTSSGKVDIRTIEPGTYIASWFNGRTPIYNSTVRVVR